jgi:hypothetical protein
MTHCSIHYFPPEAWIKIGGLDRFVLLVCFLICLGQIKIFQNVEQFNFYMKDLTIMAG